MKQWLTKSHISPINSHTKSHIAAYRVLLRVIVTCRKIAALRGSLRGSGIVEESPVEIPKLAVASSKLVARFQPRTL